MKALSVTLKRVADPDPFHFRLQDQDPALSNTSQKSQKKYHNKNLIIFYMDQTIMYHIDLVPELCLVEDHEGSVVTLTRHPAHSCNIYIGYYYVGVIILRNNMRP